MYVIVAIIQKNFNIAAQPTAVYTSRGTFKPMFPACTPLCTATCIAVTLHHFKQGSCIIYVWQIIVNLVPNFSTSIVCTHSDRRGKYCVVSHVNIGRYGTLAYNSFRWSAIRLFNSLPKFIRGITSCSVYSFKHTFDS